MLRLFAGRENIDKERFIYDNVRGEALIIVPDQYTLVAEEQALKYTGRDCLFDIEIISMSRLGLRLLTEQGTESVNMLDQYGRFMLLTRIIRAHAGEFDIFRRSAGKQGFTNMVSDFISEFKQHDCTVDKIESMLASDDADPLLKAKLGELRGVIAAYEEAVSGRLTDTEDYISRYTEVIRGSGQIRGKDIWVYGYDSMTPRFARTVAELAASARSVSCIINRNDFDLDSRMIDVLRRKCSEAGVELACMEIGPEYELEKSETIRRIERGLCARGLTEEERAANSEFEAEDLTVVCAANPYYEAESAAAYIWHLVRDLGYRMNDIQVIANDEGAMHPVIRRVFSEYGLPVFMDAARDITDTAPVAFIADLLWFVVHGMNSQYLFAMLKTGLSGVPGETVEDLENYVRTYHIRGSMWERDFRYGEEVLGTDLFSSLNEVRADIIGRIMKLKDVAGKTSVAEFTDAFREYLNREWNYEEAVETLAIETESMGANDEAQRMRESCSKALEILGQVTEIMGSEPLDLREFTEIYTAGLTNTEVGVIPRAADGLSVGTMIRTRPRPVRAVVVVGANEGILPMDPSTEGLFSVDEMRYFREKDFALGDLGNTQEAEERAAMQRMLSKPSDKLYISWSVTDQEGSEISHSSVINDLRALLPVLDRPGRILKDVVTAGWGDCSLTGGSAGDVIAAPEVSMRHMMDRIKDRNAPETEDPLMRSLLSWYRAKRSGELELMLEAAADENLQKPLGRDTAGRLFGRSDGSLVLSSSAISGYFDCPFRYYVDRGLKPREERDFASDPRSIGDAYHECLMGVARRLIDDRQLLASCGQEEIERLVDEELDRIARTYQGGLFISAGSEEFRMERIREICSGAAMAMAHQLSAGSLVEAAFEEPFSRRGRFEPVTLEVDGVNVYVEGKIDRSDILDVDGTGRARIIDYKTGSDSLDLHKMRNGYKMQLMIYLISATSGDFEPAGMFYFNIKDPIEAADGKSAGKTAELMERSPEDIYKLKGRYIDEPGVLDAMPAEVLARGNGENSRKISREEYESVRSDVLGQIEKTASGIIEGRIAIHPFRNNGRLACTHCSYKPICRRDSEYTRNYAREIKPEPRPGS